MTPRVNRQGSIYDTTKRNYFVIKSNLHCLEHPWNPTKLTRGNCFHVEEQQFHFWAIIVFEASWTFLRADEGRAIFFNNATRHINVFRNYSFYVNRIYVFGVEIQIWSCKHVADVERKKTDTRHHQKCRFWIQHHECHQPGNRFMALLFICTF